MRKLYSYFRSSAAYRVRIALQLKRLDYEIVPVHLLQDGGQQHSASYRDLNPTELVPTFVDEDGTIVHQSLAIIEFLEDKYQDVPLLPSDTAARAQVRALALDVACDIHPINNLRVLRYLAHEMTVPKDKRDLWYKHWVMTGFAAIEMQLQKSGAKDFCYGDTPSLADCCLIPQVFNAQRFAVDMGNYPLISKIANHCNSLPEFQAAHPDKQPDAV